MLEQALEQPAIKPVAIISGNRNFPNRIHSLLESTLLVSPPMVVAYAIAGHAMLDITRDALADRDGKASVSLRDLWPTPAEVEIATNTASSYRDDVTASYAEAEASPSWAALESPRCSVSMGPGINLFASPFIRSLGETQSRCWPWQTMSPPIRLEGRATEREDNITFSDSCFSTFAWVGTESLDSEIHALKRPDIA